MHFSPLLVNHLLSWKCQRWNAHCLGGAALGCRGQVLGGEGSASLPGMVGPSDSRNSEKFLLIPTGTVKGVLLSYFLSSVVFALDSCVLNI